MAQGWAECRQAARSPSQRKASAKQSPHRRDTGPAHLTLIFLACRPLRLRPPSSSSAAAACSSSCSRCAS